MHHIITSYQAFLYQFTGSLRNHPESCKTSWLYYAVLLKVYQLELSFVFFAWVSAAESWQSKVLWNVCIYKYIIIPELFPAAGCVWNVRLRRRQQSRGFSLRVFLILPHPLITLIFSPPTPTCLSFCQWWWVTCRSWRPPRPPSLLLVPVRFQPSLLSTFPSPPQRPRPLFIQRWQWHYQFIGALGSKKQYHSLGQYLWVCVWLMIRFSYRSLDAETAFYSSNLLLLQSFSVSHMQ